MPCVRHKIFLRCVAPETIHPSPWTEVPRSGAVRPRCGSLGAISLGASSLGHPLRELPGFHEAARVGTSAAAAKRPPVVALHDAFPRKVLHGSRSVKPNPSTGSAQACMRVHSAYVCAGHFSTSAGVTARDSPWFDLYALCRDRSAKRPHPVDLSWSIRGGCPAALSRGEAASTSPSAPRGHVMLRDESLGVQP